MLTILGLMSKLRISYLLHAFIICLVFFLAGCKESDFEIQDTSAISGEELSISELKNPQLKSNEFLYFRQKYTVPVGLSKWQAQLNLCIEQNSFTLKNGLELLEYNYAGAIKNERKLESVKTDLVKGNLLFPIYEDGSDNFTIGQGLLTKEDYMKMLNYFLPTSYEHLSVIRKKDIDKGIAYEFKEDDLSIVELKWRYKGEILYTTCFVSQEKGLVYDDFLYFMHEKYKYEKESVSKKISSKSGKTLSGSPRLKTTNIEECVAGPIWYEFVKGEIAVSRWGLTLYEYDISAYVGGYQKDDGSCTKYINDRSYSASFDSNLPWRCQARISPLSFETGKDGHASFIWGYTYGIGLSVSLTLSGTGFTINGGHSGSTGSDYVNPSELN